MSHFRGLKGKFIEPSLIEETALQWKLEGKRIVTLNGSFDLLHAGHLKMLEEASLQGDLLLIALNTDSSIARYKSPVRPIIPLHYRLEMMAALEMVDYVSWFDELDPRDFLQKVKPDVHVNGSEYGTECIEAEVVRAGGGKVHIVKLVPGLSTSQIIDKIVGGVHAVN